MVLGFLFKRLSNRKKKTARNIHDIQRERTKQQSSSKFMPDDENPFYMIVSVVIGFIICYFALNYLESGVKILNKQERIMNNYLWDAQVHERTVFIVHIRQNSRFKQETNKFKPQPNFSDYTAKLAREILPFTDSSFWEPYKDRLDIELTTF